MVRVVMVRGWVSLEIWVSSVSMTGKFIREQVRRKAGWSRAELQFIWLGCVTDAISEYSVCRYMTTELKENNGRIRMSCQITEYCPFFVVFHRNLEKTQCIILIISFLIFLPSEKHVTKCCKCDALCSVNTVTNQDCQMQ